MCYGSSHCAEIMHAKEAKRARHCEGRIVFGKLDVGHNREIAEGYRIMSIPALLIFTGGQLAGTKVSALPRRALEGELLKYVK